MQSPESTVTKNHQGKDFSRLKHTWKAQWITHPFESTLDYGVFLFRRNFILKRNPDKFVVFVSADNRYRLYVNGKRVAFGPSLGDPQHQRYETIDISKWLHKGDNLIAAEVVNFGEYRKVAQQTYQTAFILQGDESNEVDINTGNTEWKVIKNHAYSAIPFTSEDLNSYYAAGPCDRLDASKHPWGWNEFDFNDSAWLKPKLATTEFAVGRGFLYGSAWFLVPRTLPFMEERFEAFTKIVRSTGVDVGEAFLEGKVPLKISANTRLKILIDQKYHTTGFPELSLSKGRNSSIKITYAEALIKETDPNKPLGDGNLLFTDLKGNRNETEGKKIMGYYDIIMPDGGENRCFKPLSRRTYRFIELEIETREDELILDKFHGVYTGYPFEEVAKFEVDNPFLEKVWENSWRTLRNSAEESFFDPYYEQLQYIGDTRIESLISIYVSGDDRLMRKALMQFDDSRITEGLTQSRYPSAIAQIIPPYSLLWIDMIHDYFMYRDDPNFLRQFIPGISSVLDWFARHIDDNNMLSGLKWWNFTDWAEGFPNGIPPGADDGHSANVSLQLVKSLINAARLFEYFGIKKDSEKYSLLADKIKDSVHRLCYDETKGLIAETPEKKEFSQHTNIFAVLTNTIEEKKQTHLMKRVLEDESLIKASLYFRFYLFRALQKAGMGDKYLDQLSPWQTMIDNGMTSFGETDINPRSECHAWSASPCFDLLHTVAGIYPAEPSFRSVIIEPRPGRLKEFNAELPHPKGIIKLIFSSQGSKINANITLPAGLNGTFKWNAKSVKLNEGEQKISI